MNYKEGSESGSRIGAGIRPQKRTRIRSQIRFPNRRFFGSCPSLLMWVFGICVVAQRLSYRPFTKSARNPAVSKLFRRRATTPRLSGSLALGALSSFRSKCVAEGPTTGGARRFHSFMLTWPKSQTICYARFPPKSVSVLWHHFRPRS